MTEVNKKLGLRLDELIIAMQKYYDKERKSIESFKNGYVSMLYGRNILLGKYPYATRN
jgi:hypothetical protein